MNKKGFTLIELLAVIIILGILMIIAIPSVTKYINDSRKSSYIDTARELVAGARNLVNDGKLEMYDTDATYYIDVACIKTENGGKAVSPYGDFVKDRAFVVVTFDGKGYDYYWTSIDDSGQGVKNLIKYDNLDPEIIESDLKADDIKIDRGIDGRSEVILITERNNCQKEGSISAGSQVDGETGQEMEILLSGSQLITKLSSQLQSIGDYNYIFKGGNPSNYVLFNGELWRIIGIYENMFKIQRVVKLGGMRFNDSTWDNNSWDLSTLKSYLNGDYYNSLPEETQNMIATGTWYVGGVSYLSNASEVYENSKSLTSTSKVGLFSVYEYLYASDGENCYDVKANNYNSFCANTEHNWMNTQNYVWSMSKYYNTTIQYAMGRQANGSIDTFYSTNEYGVYPVVYLKSSVSINGGAGTQSNPYTLSE